jgi:hypothetical protein
LIGQEDVTQIEICDEKLSTWRRSWGQG